MDDMKRRALAELERKANRDMRIVALELTGRIKRTTPVDTGRARSNWNVSANKPDTSTFDAGKDPAAYAAHDRSKDAENNATVQQTNFWRGDVGWIANGLPYIVGLEQGNSKQAPRGMVRVSVEGLRPWIAKVFGRAS